MNIYCELKKNSVRLRINAAEIEIKVGADFYSKSKNSYHMFLDKVTNAKIKNFVTKHRNKLGFYEKLGYMFSRNRVLVMVDKDVQELMSIRLVHAYATLSLDAKVVFVIRKPNNFTEDNLETIEVIKDSYVNNGKVNQDIAISKLK